jgi:SAM-dependent methyltransferase
MSGFSASWLALREPHDKRARSIEVLNAVVTAFASHLSLNVADIGCGTGSTYRALSPRLPPTQRWRLYDNDLSLLARAAGPTNVTTMPLDLAHDLEAALDGAVDLVTTSALLDLVSVSWLERFATEAAARRLPVYAALSYDGRAKFDPVDDLDVKVIAAVNAHQRTDKGFGPALGPAAAQAAVEQFERLDFAVMQGVSDWIFQPGDREIQTEILSGWASAARETGDLPLDQVIGWLTRRRELVSNGRSTIRVGHIDFFARPIGMR